MGKGIFFNLPGAKSHINPTLALVQALIKQGETIIYYADEGSKIAIEKTGAQFRSYAGHFDFVHGCQWAQDLPAFALKQFELCQQAMPTLIPVIQQDAPDYILYDFCCGWGKHLAQYLGLPKIATMASFVVTPWLMLGGNKMAWAAIQQIFGHPIENMHHLRRFKAFSKQYGLPYRGLLYHAFDSLAHEGDLNLVHIEPEFQPFRNKLGQHYHFVGFAPPTERDEDCDLDIPLNKPLIYIALGTLHNDRMDFYRLCIETFKDTPYTVLMAVGKSVSIENLGPLPANIFVRPFVAQLKALEKAALFITHAGPNSLHEALYYGVPMVFYPQTLEQEFFASRSENLGLGKTLDRKKSTASDLLQLCDQVMANPDILQAVARFQARLRASHALEKAIKAIFDLVEPGRKECI